MRNTQTYHGADNCLFSLMAIRNKRHALLSARTNRGQLFVRGSVVCRGKRSVRPWKLEQQALYRKQVARRRQQ